MAMMKRGSGNGVSVRGGVRTQMGPSFAKDSGSKQGVGGGRYGSIAAPFDKPQSMGGGGVPVKMMDGMSAKSATTMNSGQAPPIMKGTQSVGKRRFGK